MGRLRILHFKRARRFDATVTLDGTGQAVPHVRRTTIYCRMMFNPGSGYRHAGDSDWRGDKLELEQAFVRTETTP